MAIIGPRSVLSHIWELRKILFSVKEFQEPMSYQIGFGTKPQVSSPFPICAHTLWTATSSHKHFEIDPRNCSNSRWKCRPKLWRKHNENLNRLCINSGLDSGQPKYYRCAHVNPRFLLYFPCVLIHSVNSSNNLQTLWNRSQKQCKQKMNVRWRSTINSQ